MGVLTGPNATIRAGRLLIANPRLIPLALFPALVTCAVSCLGVWLAIAYGDALVVKVWAEPEPGWLHWVWWTVIQIVRISSALLAVFINPWLVLLFGVPLSSPLASAADDLLGGRELGETNLSSMSRSIFVAVCLTLVGVGGSAILFVLSFVPLVGLLMGPLAGFVWTPTILCYDLYDGAMSRRQASIGQRIRVITGRPLASLSLGLVGTLLLSIPVINLIGLPLSVIAGVIAVRDLEESGDVEFGLAG
jgi:CysZ protein